MQQNNISNNKRKPLVVVGVPDAFVAGQISRSYEVDYIWVSSLVLSAMHGTKDNGIGHFEEYMPLVRGITTRSSCPVIIDADIGGRDMIEMERNMRSLLAAGVGGVCLEDEPYPKTNAMLQNVGAALIPIEAMVEKISLAKKVFENTETLIIARSHTLITGESLSTSQARVDAYAGAGADALCMHYTEGNWGWYSEMISSLRLPLPLFLILSKENTVPRAMQTNPNVGFVVFPNQIYRRMTHSLEKGMLFEDDTMTKTRELLDQVK